MFIAANVSLDDFRTISCACVGDLDGDSQNLAVDMQGKVFEYERRVAQAMTKWEIDRAFDGVIPSIANEYVFTVQDAACLTAEIDESGIVLIPNWESKRQFCAGIHVSK